MLQKFQVYLVGKVFCQEKPQSLKLSLNRFRHIFVLFRSYNFIIFSCILYITNSISDLRYTVFILVKTSPCENETSFLKISISYYFYIILPFLLYEISFRIVLAKL